MSIHNMIADVPAILNPKEPLVNARLLLNQHRTPEGHGMIALHCGEFYRWVTSGWMGYEDEAVRQLVYRFLETKTCMVPKGDTEIEVPFAPNARKVSDLIDAMHAECHIPQTFSPPCWLDTKTDRPPVHDLLVCKNGLVHLPAFVAGDADYLTPPTPLFFNLNALDFDFAASAPWPENWWKFLSELWPDDPDSILLLQEFFGYLLTCDTSLQKMLLLYGPPRSGKGTVARVLTALLGRHNVCTPTMSGLAMDFGMASMIGKSAAIIGDAHIPSGANAALITDRLLGVSGEDVQTIPRKNREDWIGRLPTRFILLSNSLPKLVDASGALPSRFLILRLVRSFLGVEDTGLEAKLLAELPGILLWSIEGWKRLKAQGRFTVPASSAEAVAELDDLGSPTKAFVRETCTVAAGQSVIVDDLFIAWKTWCDGQGREHKGTKATFGRDLGAAYPGIRRGQRTIHGVRVGIYEGISLGPCQ